MLSKKVAFSLILCLVMVSSAIVFFDSDSSATSATVDGYTVEILTEPSGSGYGTLAITGYANALPEEYTVPAEFTIDSKKYAVLQIGDDVFKNCNTVKVLTVPDTVTSIGVAAFENCIKLEKINLGSNLKTIGDRAFKNCYSVTAIYFKTSPELGKQSLCLGVATRPVECELHGFEPSRPVKDDTNPYADVFFDESGHEYTKVKYMDINPDRHNAIIHIALISLGVFFLIFMGRTIKVKKIKRPKVKKSKGKKKK